MLIRDIFKEMDDIRKNFHYFVNDYENEYYRKGQYPLVNIKEDENTYNVEALLPGVNPEEVEITFENGVLTLSGEIKSDLEEGKKYLRQERLFGPFKKHFKINRPVDVENIKARYKDGILNVTLNKAAEAKPVKIAIN